METGFKAPLKPKEEIPRQVPVDGKNTPWNFEAPQYDQRSSCFVNAGTRYGVGFKTPVGHSNDPKQYAPTLPFGDVNTMRVDEK